MILAIFENGVICLCLDPNKAFKSLAPSNNIEGIDSYIHWLDEIVNDDKYGNIAMTGDLGVGKSSVIRTFEHKKQYKFIYLSASDLGYRDDNRIQNSSIEKTKLTDEIQLKLEKDLLVQLISLCKQADIPKSHFRIVPESKSRCSKNWNGLYSVICGISFFCAGKLVANRFLSDDYLKINFVPFQWAIILVFLGLTAALGIYRLLTNYKLSKLSIGKEKDYTASAEIDRSTLEPETLDTNLHEILYLFEQLVNMKTNKQETRMPVFIIEDLDRYHSDICIPILTKLKQINRMLNYRYRNQNCGYGMFYKFIYLLNDRIFDVSEDRADSSGNVLYLYEDTLFKFFDIIIPVLPKLGYTNSADIMKSFFSKEIDKEFIDEICCFVYDYRMLIDIDNEFHVYKDRFGDELSQTSLLAFVIYKVFYKKKYDQLYKGKNDGEPISELLKSILMPDVYPDKDRDVDIFEHILEEKFKDDLFKILQMSEAIKNKFKSKLVAKDGNTDFAKSNLSRIDLSGQDLRGRDFTYVKLNGANLRGANLRDVNLTGADLTGAKLVNADLTGSILIDADMSDSILHGANLTSAKLMGALLLGSDLNAAKLRSANLQNAEYDSSTIFPSNFKPDKRGMKKRNSTTFRTPSL